MDWKEKITELAQQAITNPAHFLVHVAVSKHKPMKFTVIVDGDQGITIDDCATISKTLNGLIENLIEDNYTIEVTTPGLDHPLAMKRQFEKNKGRKLKIQLMDKKIIVGILQHVGEEKIQVNVEMKKGKETEFKTTELLFTEIEKAFVTVSFNK